MTIERGIRELPKSIAMRNRARLDGAPGHRASSADRRRSCQANGVVRSAYSRSTGLSETCAESDAVLFFLPSQRHGRVDWRKHRSRRRGLVDRDVDGDDQSVVVEGSYRAPVEPRETAAHESAAARKVPTGRRPPRRQPCACQGQQYWTCDAGVGGNDVGGAVPDGREEDGERA